MNHNHLAKQRLLLPLFLILVYFHIHKPKSNRVFLKQSKLNRMFNIDNTANRWHTTWVERLWIYKRLRYRYIRFTLWQRRHKKMSIIFIFSIFIILSHLFSMPYLFLGAAIQSNGTGGGNWSAGASWNGGVAPGDGDVANILTNDTITIDGDTTVGDGTTAMTIGDLGEVVQSAGTTLYIKGSIDLVHRALYEGTGTAGNPCTIHQKTNNVAIFRFTATGTATTSTSYGVHFSGVSGTPNIITADGGFTATYIFDKSTYDSNETTYYMGLSYVSLTIPTITYLFYTYHRYDTFVIDWDNVTHTSTITSGLFCNNGRNGYLKPIINDCSFTTVNYFYMDLNRNMTWEDGNITDSTFICNDNVTAVFNKYQHISIDTGDYTTFSGCVITNNGTGAAFAFIGTGIKFPRCYRYIDFNECTFSSAGANKVTAGNGLNANCTFRGCGLTTGDFSMGTGNYEFVLANRLQPTITDNGGAPASGVDVMAITGLEDTDNLPYDICGDSTNADGKPDFMYLEYVLMESGGNTFYSTVANPAHILFAKDGFNQWSNDGGANWYDMGTPLTDQMNDNYTTTINIRYTAGGGGEEIYEFGEDQFG